VIEQETEAGMGPAVEFLYTIDSEHESLLARHHNAVWSESSANRAATKLADRGFLFPGLLFECLVEDEHEVQIQELNSISAFETGGRPGFSGQT